MSFITVNLICIAYQLLFFYTHITSILIDFLSATGSCLQAIYAFVQNYWLAIVFCFLLLSWLRKKLIYRKQKYDYHHLQDLLFSDDSRLPAIHLDDLVHRLVGPDGEDGDTKQVADIIKTNIALITEKMHPTSTDKIIIINNAWGSGKTTNVLLAIEKIEKDYPGYNRYIYESAFRYADGTVEFTREIIHSLGNVLTELKIHGTKSAIDNLASHLGSTPYETVISALKHSAIPNQTDTLMTTNLVSVINQRFAEAKLKTTIYIIIDDLDRLLGDDIHKVISLLSILRRLTFVKIIMPLEQNIVIEQLEKFNISQPERFIQKYLPECSTIQLKNNYSIIEQLALQKLKSYHENKVSDNTKFCAAWAAILLKIFSNKLQTDSRNWKDNRISSSTTNSLSPPPDSNRSRTSKLILESSNSHVSQICNTLHASGNTRIYDRTIGSRYDAREFEEVFLQVKYLPSNDPVTVSFTEDAYYDLIASWVFGFAEKIGQN